MRVFIADMAGGVGRLAAERLVADPFVESVIGLDARPCRPPVPGLRFMRATLRQPEWVPLLEGVDVVIYPARLVGWPRHHEDDAFIVEDTKYFLRAVAAAGVRKVIVANSAALYGVRGNTSRPEASPARPLSESAPVRGHQGSAYARARALVADYLDVFERTASHALITRLRAVGVCGPHHPNPIRHFVREPVLVCGYEDRCFQVVHEDDLVAALMLAIRQDMPGVYHVSADEGITFRELAALVGKERACVPLAWLTLRAWWGWRWRRRRTPPLWVRSLYLRAPVDAARLRAAGWTPAHTTRATLAEVLATWQAGV